MPTEPPPARAGTLASADPRSDAPSPGSLEETFASARTVSAGAGSAEAPAFVRGTTLGRYVILDRIGEGGMGVVYTAYDPELDRKLALKLLRYDALGGSGSSEGRARLLREAQAMARLSHPNVITVHDVGTYAGQVFVAMEFVEGGTLRAWLGTARTWWETVALFVQAGRGLAAAHAQGIVHRDFKPENVLVAKDGRARVADFGIAHGGDRVARSPESAALVLGSDRSSGSLETPLTEQGRLLGTPLYMAPEQFDGERTDASGDQFSFCVSLYEALYGELPFEGSDLITLPANMRSGKIRIPRGERNVPAWLRQVVTRGLSARPQDRFPSMDALLAALEQDPARARRRWMVAGAVALITGATLGVLALRSRGATPCPSAEPLLAGAWDDASRDSVRRAFRDTRKSYAEDALRGVEKALDGYAASWMAMHDETCAATRIRGQQSGELMDLRMECLDDRLAGLRALTQQFEHADAKIVERALQASYALEPLKGCADKVALRSPTHLPGDPSLRKQIETIRGQLAEAHAIGYAKPGDALVLAKSATFAANELHYKPLEAEALDTEGVLLVLNGSFKEGAAALEDATLAAEAGHHESIETKAWIDLTHAEGKDSRDAEGRAAARHAHACIERGGGDDDSLATLLSYEGEVAVNEDRIDEAIALEKRAIAILEAHRPADHPDLAEPLYRLSDAMRVKGDFDAALAHAERSVAIREKAFGPVHPAVATPLNDLGNAFASLGRLDDAVRVYRRTLDIKIAAFGEDTITVADTLGNLGLVYNMQGKQAESIALGERALAIRLRVLGPDHADLEISYGDLADAQNEAHRWDDAIANASRRYSIREKISGPNSPLLASPLTQLGQSYLGKGDTKRAVATLEKALELGEGRDAEPEKMADTKESLALALVRDHGDRARARRLAKEARATYAAGGERTKEDVARLDKEFP